MPVVHYWRQAAHPEDIARLAAGHLSNGRLVVLPTEVGPVLAATPGVAVPAAASGAPRYLAFADAAAVAAHYADVTADEAAWGRRVWPGPVAWQRDDGPDRVWVPDHLLTAAVVAAVGPLALYPVTGGPAWGDEVAAIVADEHPAAGAMTVVRLADREWAVLHAGSVSEEAIREKLARRIVFVCTGNTCRSPMAEALFKHELAARLGCRVAELPAKGFRVQSAGTGAGPGEPPSPEAVAVLLEWTVDHTAHRSTPAGADLIAAADDIVGMTRTHLLAVLSRYPVIRGALRLLGGAEGDLDDPIGGGPAVYRACAENIRRHVTRLLTEMGLT